MTDYTELQKAAVYAAQDTIKFSDESEEMRALQQFHEEVDPETVLALIAENERLFNLLERMVEQYVPLTELEGVPGWSRVVELVEVVAERDHLALCARQWEEAAMQWGAERDQLKAENEALRQSLADHKACIASDNELFREANLECNRYHSVIAAVGELLGISKEEQDEEEVTQEELIEAINELWGQVHGMQEDLDEYKAENEALRKNDRRYQRVRDIACRVRASEGFRLEVRLPSPAGYDFNTAKAFDTAIDAALGKGEQS